MTDASFLAWPFFDEGYRDRELVEWIARPTAGPRLIEIRTDRHENARLHEQIWASLAR